jgi:hypothetical protein
MMNVAFKVNKGAKGHEGVTLTFANGAHLSIQSSPTHYCTVGKSVEVHAWGPKQERVWFSEGCDLLAHVLIDQLPAIMQKVQAWRAKI